jgi:FAD synthetase
MDDDVYISKSIHQALACLENALRLYQPNNIICSFNGGKDAVVILHLLRAALAKYYHQSTKEDKDGNDLPPLLQRPRVIYFDHEHEFPEMNDFLQETVQAYDLDMIAFDANITFAQGLKLLVDNNILPNTPASPAYPMAFILGTRESDPNAHAQGYFAPSSSNYMPPFMRVNPIWHWNYGHVWHFLRLLNLPYCSLYDQGYTSLGTTLNTLPCPALQVAGMTMIDATTKQEVPKYWPAYMLRDYDQERAGRVASSSSNAAAASKKKQNGTVKQEGNEGGGFQSLKTSSSNLDQLSNLDDGTLNETTAAEDGEEASVVSFGSDSYRQKSVGLLVIGDEILKGFTHDTNTQAAAKALFGQNVVLKRVVVVSDKQDAIVQEIHRLQKEVDVIITSGGVGPTHDDVTIKSVAQALETEMIIHEEMAQLLKDKMNDGDPSAELSEAQLKMATLPSSSKLRYLSGPTNWPVLQVRNIFVLPGVPEFFEAKIEDVSRYLSCQLERSVAYKVVLSVDENSIVPVLNAVVENHPSVSFGSYPFVSHPDYKTVITVEGRLLTNMTRSNSSYFNPSDLIVGRSPKEDLDKHVQVALDELITSLPSGSVLRVDNDDLLL